MDMFCFVCFTLLSVFSHSTSFLSSHVHNSQWLFSNGGPVNLSSKLTYIQQIITKGNFMMQQFPWPIPIFFFYLKCDLPNLIILLSKNYN